MYLELEIERHVSFPINNCDLLRDFGAQEFLIRVIPLSVKVVIFQNVRYVDTCP
jgi:hypothetical protein